MTELPPSGAASLASIEAALPPAVGLLLETLRAAGHDAYVVGGSIRDVLLGRDPADWDLATNARPEQLLDLFPGAVYRNRFGTVAVDEAGETYEITTFRRDHDYADFRRPHRVEFTDAVEADLARRDFTVNAIAWGGSGAADRAASAIVDPHGGLADLATRTLRAVGEPRARFEEDALRMIRAVRLAATLGFGIEPRTLAGIQARSSLVRHLSGERIGAELDRLLAAPAPSVGFRLMSDTGLLVGISPALAAQRGLPQNKIPGDDCWDHTLRTVDAVPAERSILRLAALVHDIGKPATMADGHFYGHDMKGATEARALLGRLRYPRVVVERVGHLVRHHMFSYDSGWTDTAVRRFIAKVGRDALEDLFALRAADNIGSGQPPGAGLDELRARVGAQLEADVVLDRGGLAIDGGDLMRELGMASGPTLGRILDALLERVLVEPELNDRETLLTLAGALQREAR